MKVLSCCVYQKFRECNSSLNKKNAITIFTKKNKKKQKQKKKKQIKYFSVKSTFTVCVWKSNVKRDQVKNFREINSLVTSFVKTLI